MNPNYMWNLENTESEVKINTGSQPCREICCHREETCLKSQMELRKLLIEYFQNIEALVQGIHGHNTIE